MVAAAPNPVAPMALRQPEWTGGHRGVVGAFARDHAERETV
jgi:hypothetical protein